MSVLTVVFFSLIYFGCDEFVLWNLLSGNPNNSSSTELLIWPASADAPVGSTIPFTSTGGTPPYGYIIVSGNGSIDGTTGIYSAPNIPSVDVVRVFDDSGSSDDAQVVVYQ